MTLIAITRPSYTCAGCHPDEPHPDVDYCDNCTWKESDDQAICVHCDESHHVDDDHQCKATGR